MTLIRVQRCRKCGLRTDDDHKVKYCGDGSDEYNPHIYEPVEGEVFDPWSKGSPKVCRNCGRRSDKGGPASCTMGEAHEWEPMKEVPRSEKYDRPLYEKKLTTKTIDLEAEEEKAKKLLQLVGKALNSGWECLGTGGHLTLPGDVSESWTTVWEPLTVGDHFRLSVPGYLERRLKELEAEKTREELDFNKLAVQWREEVRPMLEVSARPTDDYVWTVALYSFLKGQGATREECDAVLDYSESHPGIWPLSPPPGPVREPSEDDVCRDEEYKRFIDRSLGEPDTYDEDGVCLVDPVTGKELDPDDIRLEEEARGERELREDGHFA